MAATGVYAILRVVDNLKTILAPILPHTPALTHRTQKLPEYLRYKGQPLGFAQGRDFDMQQGVEGQEETRSHATLTYYHGDAIGTWAPSKLPPSQAPRPSPPSRLVRRQ